jgi:hypothetical protein
MLLAESFDRLRRYTNCESYSWAVEVMIYQMLHILDNYEPLLMTYLPIIDKLIHRNSKIHRSCRPPRGFAQWSQNRSYVGTSGTSRHR